MPNRVDRMACAPPRLLTNMGVTLDNHDLLRPGPDSRAAHGRLMTMLRAQRLLEAGGKMSPSDFRDAIVEAMQMLGGPS